MGSQMNEISIIKVIKDILIGFLIYCVIHVSYCHMSRKRVEARRERQERIEVEEWNKRNSKNAY
jgi:hypothetical protein